MCLINDQVIIQILNADHVRGTITALKWRIENENVNGFASDILRVHVSYLQNGNPSSKWLFLKSSYDYALYKRIQDSHACKTVLPDLQDTLGETLVPKSFYFDDIRALVLEDSLDLCYCISDKKQKLDFEHCVQALQLLAKFHAASVKLNEKMPGVLDDVKLETQLDSRLWTEEKKLLVRDRFTKVLGYVDPLFAKASQRELIQYANQFIDFAIQDVKSTGSLNVLNHGDVRIDNIVFLYDKYRNVRGAKFVDFQLCRWNSPAFDMLYFIMVGVKPEVPEKHLDLLLEVYVAALNRTLKYLHCNCSYSMTDMNRDLERALNFGVFTLTCLVPTLSRNTKVEHIDDVALLQDEWYMEIAKTWFPYFIKKGVFSKTRLVITTNVYPILRAFESRYNAIITRNELITDNVDFGANYLSGLLRLKIDYQTGSEKFAKVLLLKIPQLCPLFDATKVLGIYEREAFIYEQLLPQMYEVWHSDLLTPACYLATEWNTIVLEDLQKSGFTLRDKNSQLDFDHCRIALRSIAQLHALSVKHYQRYPEIQDSVTFQHLCSIPPLEALMFEIYDHFLEIAKSLFSGSVYKKLQNHRNEYISVLQLAASPNAAGLNIMCHGDLWTNNIMFQHDDRNRPTKSKLIDFQLSHRGSPAADLTYFFVISVQFKVFRENRDTLLDFYLETFNGTLNSLDCNFRYSRNELDKDLEKYNLCCVNWISTFVPLVLSAESNLFNVDKKKSKLESVLKSKWYADHLRSWIGYLTSEKIL